MTERKPFKLWFDAALVREIGARVLAVEPRFALDGFVLRATEGLDALEMIARVGHIADALHWALPGPTRVALAALVASMPPPAVGAEGITGYGYALWPYGEVIARYGLDDVDASFLAMIELTQRFSAEFAVRPFLAVDPDGTLDRLEALVSHPNAHVRRWVSEGTRTRLPWGKRVPALEPLAPRRLAILARLRHDPDPYVRRSVANHLQDALKDDRALALPVLSAWATEPHDGPRWIARHAARGLLKAGDPDVLALFGHDAASIAVRHFTISPPDVAIGDSVTLQVALHNEGDSPASVRVDYELTSPGARERPNRKVFRFADVTLSAGEAAERTIRHAFAHRSIRTVRPGEHRIALRVNGRPGGEVQVQVREQAAGAGVTRGAL